MDIKISNVIVRILLNKTLCFFWNNVLATYNVINGIATKYNALTIVKLNPTYLNPQ